VKIEDISKKVRGNNAQHVKEKKSVKVILPDFM
jgi:hypothetical protein